MSAFHGRLVRERFIGDLRLSEIDYAPSQQIPPHEHPTAYVSFVLAGGYRERHGRIERLCTTSALLYHACGERHADSFLPAGGRCLNIELSGRWLSIAAPGPGGESTDEFAHHLARRLHSEFRCADGSSAMIIEGLMLELIGTMRRSESCGTRPPAWLLDARAYLHEHACKSLSLDALATRAGVHPVHFARMFRRHFRCTPGDFMRRTRVERAARQLTSTDLPLTDVAADAGFATQSHFSTVFKRYLNVTPAAYRRMHKR
jgi:AraC family transcriptional regulator